MEPPTGPELEALQSAFTAAREDAAARAATPGPRAEAAMKQARNLMSLRRKIIDTMPEIDRRNYPDYEL